MYTLIKLLDNIHKTDGFMNYISGILLSLHTFDIFRYTQAQTKLTLNITDSKRLNQPVVIPNTFGFVMLCLMADLQSHKHKNMLASRKSLFSMLAYSICG